MFGIIFTFILMLIVVIGYKAVVGYINREDYDIKNGKKEKYKAHNWIVLLILIVPTALAMFGASTVSVGTGEIAVMTRYGRVTGQELHEGFHLKSPLDDANVYNIKNQKEQVDASAASRDLQDVRTTLVINYEVTPGKVSEIHRTVGVNYKAVLIDPAIQEVVKGATAKFNATELITERPLVKAEAFNALKARLEPRGILITDLSMTNFSFSPEFTNAIEANSESQVERKTDLSYSKPAPTQKGIDRNEQVRLPN